MTFEHYIDTIMLRSISTKFKMLIGELTPKDWDVFLVELKQRLKNNQEFKTAFINKRSNDELIKIYSQITMEMVKVCDRFKSEETRSFVLFLFIALFEGYRAGVTKK